MYILSTATRAKLYTKAKWASANPSFLAVAPGNQYVYAVNEEGKDKGSGKVSAYSFNKATGQLSFINQQSTGGDDPCYVAADKTGKWITAGNYSGGSVAVLPKQADGALGPVHQLVQHSGSSTNKERQEKAHVHCTYFSADNKFLFVPDLGMDKLMIYAFNEKTGNITPAMQPFVQLSGGSGPRHIAVAPNNRYAYLMQELTGTVTVFAYSAGKLTTLQTISAAKPGFSGFMGSADIHVSPDGKFLYCSNRGDANTITIFSINPSSGKLKALGYQSTLGVAPRNFSLDPSGNFLLVANQNSDNIVIFKRNKTTGLLTDTGKKIETGNPVCLRWISTK